MDKNKNQKIFQLFRTTTLTSRLLKYLGKTAKLIKLRGYYKNTDYNKAKEAYGKWNPISQKEALEWLKVGGWIGLVIPDGYILVDADFKKIAKRLYKALKRNDIKFIGIKTPNGYQFIFKDNKKVATQMIGELTAGGFVVDYRLAGKGYIVLPTENTENRQVKYIPNVKLNYMPNIFLPVRQAKEEDEQTDIPIYDGTRDNTLFRHACKLREWDVKHKLGLGHDGILSILQTMNELFGEPPVEDNIVEAKVRSAMKYKTDNVSLSSGNKDTDRMIQIASNFPLFCDDYRNPFAYVNNIAIPIDSTIFKRWLTGESIRQYQKVPKKDAINSAIHAIASIAQTNGICFSLYNRVAKKKGVFYYDLGEGKAALTKKSGWKITNKPPILFKHHQHQQVQVQPKRGRTIQDVLKFVNIKGKNQKLLFLVYLVSCLVPEIAHPVLYIYGSQGSGKSVITRILRKLIDPTNIEELILQNKRIEAIRTMEHHYLCIFDNVSYFNYWLSDLLSQVCTGAGISARMLFTDDEDVTYYLLRCAGINGINLLVSKPDLMDRTLLFQIERISRTERKGEADMMKKFEKVRPYILGAMLNTLSKAKEIRPSVKLKRVERMADFMYWGVAIAKAMGYKGSDFITAYKENVNYQNVEVIESNSLAQALVKFMKDKPRWHGTVGKAYEKLSDYVNSKNDATFPKHSNKLRNALEQVKTNLRDYGIEFTREPATDKGIPITFINRNLEKVVKKGGKPILRFPF